MHPVFKKLQFKNLDKIYVIGAPKEFSPVLEEMTNYTTIKINPTCKQEYQFALFFVTSCDEIKKYAAIAAARVPGDGLLWFAYPKKSSKIYRTDVTRDDGWQPLGDLGFEAVRIVAIDENWSALRFRRVEFILSLQRDAKMAMTLAGKNRTM